MQVGMQRRKVGGAETAIQLLVTASILSSRHPFCVFGKRKAVLVSIAGDFADLRRRKATQFCVLAGIEPPEIFG